MSHRALSPQQFTFDIDFSADKDTLKEGKIVMGTHRVSVLAHHEHEGRLIADQMVAATGREPTGARRIR
jgi:hypothetical protein